MSQAISLLGELEDALKGGSSEKRVATLRQVTDLFLGEAERLNEHQIGVFDDLLMHLVEQVETKALVHLSTSLANVANAPMQVAKSLARNSEISIAGPILTNSIRLTDTDLIEIARSKSQGHLAAISGRTTLTEAVTEFWSNAATRTSPTCWPAMPARNFPRRAIPHSSKNRKTTPTLVERLGRRLDIPPNLLRQLLSRATDIVRSRLLASAPPDMQSKIQSALADIAKDVAQEADNRATTERPKKK